MTFWFISVSHSQMILHGARTSNVGAAIFSNCCAGSSHDLSAWVNVCPPETVQEMFHINDAVHQPCVCTNGFFSLKPGCFRFGEVCLFDCFWDFGSHSHFWISHQAEHGLKCITSPWNAFWESWDMGKRWGKASMRGKSAELLRWWNAGVFLAFDFSV